MESLLTISTATTCSPLTWMIAYSYFCPSRPQPPPGLLQPFLHVESRVVLLKPKSPDVSSLIKTTLGCPHHHPLHRAAYRVLHLLASCHFSALSPLLCDLQLLGSASSPSAHTTLSLLPQALCTHAFCGTLDWCKFYPVGHAHL